MGLAVGMQEGPRVPFRALLVLAVLAPAALLLPFLLTLRAQLGLRHPATIVAFLIVLAPSVLAALVAARSSGEAARRRLGHAAAAFVSVVLSVAALEGAVRILGFDPSRHETWRRQVGESPYSKAGPGRPAFALRPGAAWGHQYSSNERGYFDPDGAIHYRTNSAGWRGNEFAVERTPGVARIAFLGDSLGFGEGVREEETAAGRLPDLLRRDFGCAAEVYNFSVPGYSTSEEATILETVVPRYQPDLVIVWFFLNDVEGTQATMRFLGEKEARGVLSWSRSFSSLARFAAVRIDRYILGERLIRSYREAYRSDGAPLRRLQDTLARIAAWGREHDVPVVLFVHPILYHLDASYPFSFAHEAVLSRCRSLSLPAYDLLDAFRGRPAESLWVHPADQHPNEVAHGLAAAFAARRLAPHLRSCSR